MLRIVLSHSLVWSNSNSQVVTVDTQGHVNATGAGVAMICACINNNLTGGNLLAIPGVFKKDLTDFNEV